MSDGYCVLSAELSGEELLELCAASPEGCAAFAEGPLFCGFRDPRDLGGEIDHLQLVRIFGEAYELLARRNGYGSPRPWRVRQIAGCCAEKVAAPLGAHLEEERLILLGLADQDGRFGEGRYGTRVAYPAREAPSWGEGDRACVVTRRHSSPDAGGGTLVRWVRIEKWEKGSGHG